jgi:hypothetical protein
MHIRAITEFYRGTLVDGYSSAHRDDEGFVIPSGAVRADAFPKQFSDLDGYGLTTIDSEQETPAMIWHAVTRPSSRFEMNGHGK